MDWLKKHFEKVLLAAIAIALLGSAIFLFFNIREFLSLYSSYQVAQAQDNTQAALPIEDIQKAIVNLRTPASWSRHDSSLLVSRPYILRDDTLISILEDPRPVYPPVDNSYIVKYNLDYSNENLLSTDPDNDSFTVLEEWMAKTDPTDADSIPPYYTKLRLKQYIRIPFLLKFNGSPDDGQTFTINAVSLKTPTQFLKLGEMIDKTPFKLLSYEKKNIEKDGIPINESEVLIENIENGEKITLVNGKVVDSPTSKAKFVYLLDGSEIEVKKNDSFSLPQQKDVQYKLIDINDTQAVIQNITTGDEYTVPLLQPH